MRKLPNGTSGKTPARPRKRRLNEEQRRALELLAGSPHGVPEELLVLGHGFSRRMLAGLVQRGLATARHEVVKAGGQAIKVGRFRITAAGRDARDKG
jgi:hypothetical protein